MEIVNEKELKKIGLTPVDFIVDKWGDILKDKKNVGFVCAISELADHRGYLLGLATENESGYNSLGMILEEHNYNIANKWVDEANERVFKRSKKDTLMIVLSSMRRKLNMH